MRMGPFIRIQQASYEQVNEPSPDSAYAGMLILDSPTPEL